MWRNLILVAVFAVGELFAAPAVVESVQQKVEATIAQAETIPGLQGAEFAQLRPELLATIQKLVKEGAIEVEERDEAVRPCFVSLQGIIEHVLSKSLGHEVKSLCGVIHTPMPATPLCSKGEISRELIDPSLENDPLRQFTVKARAVLLRDYLFLGAKLYVLYPIGGLEKRTEEQRAIYRELLEKYPNNLFDLPLPIEPLSEELIGATYFFTDETGEVFLFSIRMTQANDPKDKARFGLWLGSLSNPAIEKRLKQLSAVLSKMPNEALPLAQERGKESE